MLWAEAYGTMGVHGREKGTQVAGAREGEGGEGEEGGKEAAVA